MVYGLTPYIREYFNTTAPSNREYKNAKNAKIANLRNIYPTKIKVRTVYANCCRHGKPVAISVVRPWNINVFTACTVEQLKLSFVLIAS